MKTLTVVVTLFTLLFAVLIPAVQAAEPVQCAATYTVQPGDTLTGIAVKFYGKSSADKAIVAATNAQAVTDATYHEIADPGLIRPGWKLCLPTIPGLTGPNVTPTAASTAPPATTAATATQPTATAAATQTCIPPSGTSTAGLEMEALRNAQYTDETVPGGTVQLANGKYSEPAAPGSASMITVIMTPWVAYGQLNGQDSAAVILVSDGGGSGSFYTLHAMQAQNGKPVEVASTQLGDRVQIKCLSIKDNQTVVDMVQAGPNDPMCCPTQEVVNTYALEGNQLKLVSSTVESTVSATPTSVPSATPGK
jgi:hypothetical protein